MTNDPLPLSKIIKGIKKKYDEDDDKEAWAVRGGRDSEGNKDMLITKDPDAWYIKSKQVDPFRHISYGTELNIKSLDDEIAAESGRKKFDPKQAFHQLFGMAVPTSEKELISASGIQRVSKPEMDFVNTRLDERYPNIRNKMRKKVRKTWKKQFPDRDNVYL